MTGRSLAYLAGVPIERVRGVGPSLGKKLRDGGLGTVADLLLHAPRRYIDRSRVAPIADLRPGDEATVVGTVRSISSRRIRGGRTMAEATVSDGRSTLRVTWFNQPFRERQLPPGTEVALFGKVDTFKRQLQLTNPVTERLRGSSETTATGRIVPIYPTVAGTASWKLQSFVENALPRARPILDPLPDDIVKHRRLRSRDEAIAAIHLPDSDDDHRLARERLVYDELFRLELALALAKHHQRQASRGVAHAADGRLVDRFLAGLPYDLTDAQQRVLEEIRRDLTAVEPMHRLLQGEVGSGKTVVAVATLLWGIEGGYQGAVMAPTEVLAGQHFLGISALLEEAGMAPPEEGEGLRLGMDSLFTPGEGTDQPIRMALLTSTQVATNFTADARRSDVLEWVADGRVDLVVGTHALIQEGVGFHRLGVAVVDEQHRFGVAQRVTLRDKGGDHEPDLLIMTATPIPRTLSMTLYGDLDVSVIDELPPGRTPIRTRSFPKAEEAQVWDLVRKEVTAGRQAFVVCPLVEDSPKVEAASATAEHERLTGLLSGLEVGLIHGQLHPREKEQVMDAFREGQLDVLVSTTVIEVGIDVPNASVIVVEDAERFGLSQLHQLRGRVGRGRHPGTCVLLADPTTEDGEERIAAMLSTTDGFELANQDLRIRGQGTVFGERQSGMADLKLADVLRDFETLTAARADAFAIVDADPDLEEHPELSEELKALFTEEQREWLFKS